MVETAAKLNELINVVCWQLGTGSKLGGILWQTGTARQTDGLFIMEWDLCAPFGVKLW